MIAAFIALALQTSTTECTTYGNSIYCRHTPSLEERGRAFDEEMRAFQDRQDRIRENDEADKAKRETDSAHAAEIANEIIQKEALRQRQRRLTDAMMLTFLEAAKKKDCATVQRMGTGVLALNPQFAGTTIPSDIQGTIDMCWTSTK